MGHASQIALGIALAQPARTVVCIDGDGALLMHMGSLAVIGHMRPRNLIHVVLNNGAHDSVGGQPTAGLTADLCAVAAACGYAVAERVTAAACATRLRIREKALAPAFFEVLITPGARADLGRPVESPATNRQRLMEFLAAGALA
jgi:phosphonopyruvate decarboxylase